MTDFQLFRKPEHKFLYEGWSFEPIHGDDIYWLGVFDRFPREQQLWHRDAEEIYNALAFMNWKGGVIANVLLTINWEEMGVPQSCITKRLGKYLNELQKWLKGGQQVYRRRGSGPRPHVDLCCVWVHEVDPKRGLHSHILLHVPRDIFPSFRAWTSACIERHHGSSVSPSSVYSKLGYGKNLTERVGQQWHWFKYLIKQLSPHSATGLPGDLVKNSRDFFNPYRKRPSMPIPPINLVGASRNIKRPARERASFVSFAQRGNVSMLYEGREILESNPLLKSLVVDSTFCFPGCYERPTRRRRAAQNMES